MVETIANVYHALPDSERAVASVYVQNYGEAGAIDYYRETFDVPPAMCGHNNYYLWGTRGRSGQVLIAFGGAKSDYEKVYESVQQVTRFEHLYVMPYENNRPVFICRTPKVTLDKVWSRTKHFG